MNFDAPIISGFYDYCASIRKLKPASIKDFRCTINKLAKHIDEKNLDDYIWKLELESFVDYFCSLRARGESGTGISKQLSQVRTLIDYCWRAGYCTRNVLRGFSIKDDSEKYIPRFLDINEVTSLIKATGRKSRLDRKERLVILILYGLGLRNSELRNLKVQDISLDDEDIFVRGKFDIERRVPVPAGVWVELLAYLHEQGKKKGLLFKTEHKKAKLGTHDVGDIVKKYASEARLKEGVTPKALRHTFASHLIREGVDVSVISTLMGHKSPRETGAYLHAFEEDLRRAASDFNRIMEVEE